MYSNSTGLSGRPLIWRLTLRSPSEAKNFLIFKNCLKWIENLRLLWRNEKILLLIQHIPHSLLSCTVWNTTLLLYNNCYTTYSVFFFNLAPPMFCYLCSMFSLILNLVLFEIPFCCFIIFGMLCIMFPFSILYVSKKKLWKCDQIRHFKENWFENDFWWLKDLNFKKIRAVDFSFTKME